MRLVALLPYVVLFVGCVSQTSIDQQTTAPVTKEQVLDRIVYLESELNVTSMQIAEAEQLRTQWATAASGSSPNLFGGNSSIEGFRQVSNAVITLQNHYHGIRRELSKLNWQLEKLKAAETPKKVTTPQ